MILILAGSIRGAVAFALILIVKTENSALLEVTTYINLMISTIFMGAAMPHLLKIIIHYRLRKYPETEASNQNEISELLIQDISINCLSAHQHQRKSSNIFHLKWRKIDDAYFKPFFIRNYIEVKEEIDNRKQFSVDEVYKVEFNQGCLNYRNPLPYSIKEINLTEVKDHKNYLNLSDCHIKDDNFMLLEEEEIKGKSDFDVTYLKKDKLFPGNECVFKEKRVGSLGSVAIQDEEEVLSRKLMREKIRDVMLRKSDNLHENEENKQEKKDDEEEKLEVEKQIKVEKKFDGEKKNEEEENKEGKQV